MSRNDIRGEELEIQEYLSDRVERHPWRGWRHEEESKHNYDDIETLEDFMFGPDVAMTAEMADAIYQLRVDMEGSWPYDDDESDDWPYDDNYDNEPTHEQLVDEAYRLIEEQALRDDEIDIEMRLNPDCN